VTDLVPSEMACLESSPGRMRRTEVWISRDEIVDFLLYDASFDASDAIRSKMSLTNELRIDMALLEIPVSGWTVAHTHERNGSGLRPGQGPPPRLGIARSPCLRTL
jgi:hypothetical protein